MEISNSTVERIAEQYKISLPDIFKDKPERAFAFLYGYLLLSGLPEASNLTTEMRDLIKDRRHDLETAIELGFTMGHPEVYEQTKQQAYEFGSKREQGKTSDLCELHQRMSRNPSFIPKMFWPNSDSDTD